MKAEYDLSTLKSRPNPYAAKLKKPTGFAPDTFFVPDTFFQSSYLDLVFAPYKAN